MNTRTNLNQYINHDQYYKLTEWIKERKSIIEAQRPTIDELREQANASLGFKSSYHAVSEARRSAGVMVVSKKCEKFSPTATLQTKVLALEGRVATLENAILYGKATL